MNMKVKTTLIILFTLLIGIILGVFIDRTIMRFQFRKRIAEVRQTRGITSIFERIIEPTESQSEAVEKILAKYSNRLHDLREKSHLEMAAVMDSLRTELEPILTDQQKARLKRAMERMRDRRDREPHPRPPFPPPFEGQRQKPPR
jgi:hypothetical protein